MKNYILFIFLNILVVVDLYSQDIENDTIKEIQEVVITGTLKETNKRFLPYIVSIVSKDEIEKSTSTSALEIISDNIPGVFVTQRSNMGFGVAQGSAGTITSRGLGGFPTTQVLMLIDGHPQFMGIMGHHLPDAYSILNAEKVEVLRGPASLLYGSNALGGVINIITLRPIKEGLQGSAMISTGYFGTYNFLNTTTLKNNKTFVTVASGISSTDGYRKNSSFNANSGYLKVGHTFSKNFNIISDIYVTKYKASDPGPDTIGAKPGIVADIFRGYWSIALKNNFDNFSGDARFYHNFGEHNLTDGFHSRDYHLGFQVFETISLFKNLYFSIGTDYARFGGRASGTVNIDTFLYDFGIFGLINYTLFNRITFNAGLRRQDHKYAGIQYIPSLGFVFFNKNNYSFKFNISKGYRNPTLREIFLVSHINNLKPENVVGYDFSFSYNYIKWNSYFEMSLFYISGNDLLIRLPSVGLVNQGKIENKGIEFTLNIKPLTNLYSNIIYSYINMKEPVYATPEHNLNAKIGYTNGIFNLYTGLKFISNMDNDASNKVNKISFCTIDMGFAYKLFKNLNFIFNINNLTNKKYEIIRYYPMPGFNIDGGIKISY